jgi:hypothetical protein
MARRTERRVMRRGTGEGRRRRGESVVLVVKKLREAR